MINLILFELKKAVHNRKNWIILLFFCLILVLFSASNSVKNKNEIKDTIKYCNELTKWYQEKSITYQELYQQDKAEVYQQFSKVCALRSKAFERKGNALKNGNKKEELAAELDYLKAQENYFSHGSEYIVGDSIVAQLVKLITLGDDYMISEATKYYENQLDFYNMLQKHHIKLMNHNEMTGVNFLYLSFNQLLPYVLVLFLLLYLSDFVSYEQDMGSFKFLLLQPLSRGKVIISKSIAATIVSFISVLVPFLLVFLMNSGIHGMGSLDYPVLQSTRAYHTVKDISNSTAINYMNFNESSEDTGGGVSYRGFSMKYDTAYQAYDLRYKEAYLGISKYIPQGEDTLFGIPSHTVKTISISSFLLKAIPTIALAIVFSSILAVFISMVAPSSLISMVICTIIGAFAMVFQAFSESKGIYKIIPFSYLDSVSMLNGFGRYPMLLGIIVLSIWSVIFIMLGWLYFRKKDIRC